MTIFSSSLASIGVLVAQHPGVPAGPIPAHHASAALGAVIIIFIVMLAALIAAVVQVMRQLASLYNLLMRALSFVVSVLFSVVLITGVSVALLIHR